ncbi:MAG: hypothetical protein ACRC10_08300 [Thermoguttaceae bacterium]
MSTDSLSPEQSVNRQVSLPFQSLANSLASAEEKLHSFHSLFQSFAQMLQDATDRLVEVEKTIVQAKTALAQCEPQLQSEKMLGDRIKENDDRWSKKWSEREEQWGKIFAGMQQLLGQLSTAVPGLGAVPTNPDVLASHNPTSSPLYSQLGRIQSGSKETVSLEPVETGQLPVTLSPHQPTFSSQSLHFVSAKQEHEVKPIAKSIAEPVAERSSSLPNIVDEKEVFSLNEHFELNEPAEEQRARGIEELPNILSMSESAQTVLANPIESTAETSTDDLDVETAQPVATQLVGEQTQQGQEEREDDFEITFDITQPQTLNSQSETFGLADSADSDDFSLSGTVEQSGIVSDEDSFAANELEDDFELLDSSVQSNSSPIVSTQSNSPTSPESTARTHNTSEEADFELGAVKNGNVFNISELLKSFSTTDS